MKGTIKTLVQDRLYGFIQAPSGTEYFFHRDNFKGHWNDMYRDWQEGIIIEVEFEPELNNAKGPRASNVRRTRFPNEAV